MLIMVLNDGETWSALDGCCIVEIQDGPGNYVQADDVELALENDEDKDVAAFVVKEHGFDMRVYNPMHGGYDGRYTTYTTHSFNNV